MRNYVSETVLRVKPLQRSAHPRGSGRYNVQALYTVFKDYFVSFNRLEHVHKHALIAIFRNCREQFRSDAVLGGTDILASTHLAVARITPTRISMVWLQIRAFCFSQLTKTTLSGLVVVRGYGLILQTTPMSSSSRKTP